MKAIVMERVGGPEVLQYTELPKPSPGEDEVLIRNIAIGINYIDINCRLGLYKLDQEFPAIIGKEGSGIVEAIGNKVRNISVGDEVAYCLGSRSYAEYITIHEDKVVKLPEAISMELAAASMLQGLTAHYLVTSCYSVKKGDKVLIQAAAGGMGTILCQLCHNMGAFVIGTVSNEKKAQIAKENGADEVIIYTKEDFVSEVKRLTGNQGVHVIYDGVGKDTFMGNLDCLRTRGSLVQFGNASGRIPPFDVGLLSEKGSIILQRPALWHFIAEREEFHQRVRDLFSWLEKGELKIQISKTYNLSEASQAHRDIEDRVTTGKLLLKP